MLRRFRRSLCLHFKSRKHTMPRFLSAYGATAPYVLSLLSALVLFAGCAGSTKLHKESTATLVLMLNLEKGGLLRPDPKGGLFMIQLDGNILSVSHSGDSLDFGSPVTVAIPEDLTFIDLAIPRPDTLIFFGGREQRGKLDLYGVAVDLSTRTVINTVPLFSGLDWKGFQYGQAFMVRWNRDSSRVAFTCSYTEYKKQHTRLEGGVYNLDLSKANALEETYKWQGEKYAVRVDDLLFDRAGSLGVVRTEYGEDTCRVCFAQVTGPDRSETAMIVPARIDGGTITMHTTVAAIDSADRLFAVAFLSRDAKLLGVSSLYLPLDRRNDTATRQVEITRDSAKALFDRKELAAYSFHSPYDVGNGRIGIVAEQVRYLYYTLTRGENSPVYTQFVYGPIFSVTVDSTGSLSLQALVAERKSAIDGYLHHVPGPQLLNGAYHRLRAQVVKPGNRRVLLYTMNNSDLFSVPLDLPGTVYQNPLLDHSGLGVILHDNTQINGRGELVIPSVQSIMGRCSIAVLALPQ